MKFDVIARDNCFYYLRALKNGFLVGTFKISKGHFHSFDAENEGEYFKDLEEYVGIYHELLISDNILSEIYLI